MENDKEKKLIYSLLHEENLEAFYSSIRSELHVYKVEDLLHVTRKDLCRIGVLSGPDVRRFEKVILKVTKNAGIKGKFSKVLAKKPKQANVDLPATISLWEDFEPVIIKTEDLKLKDILGAGNFGEVFKGEWTRRLAGHETVIPVAVKCLKEESNKSFIKEVSVLSQLDQKHDNIVKLYGICIQEDRIRMVTEFAEEGSLLDKLRKGEILSITLLCQFAVQIASGMMYLEKKGLVHRDLAARNILVTAHNQVKVSDFGLAKLVGQDKEWVMTSEEVLPIRWLGLESLLEGKFTSASDVWSFGVVLWELFSFGEHPYDGLNSFEVIEKLKKNERLQEPEYCPSKIYSLVMKRCWHENPDERMKFEDAKSCLVSIHPTSSLAVSSQHYLDELKYAVGDIITAIKPFEGAADLWIGQNERTFEFGKYIKSQTRPLQSKIPFAATVTLSPGYDENSLASTIQNGQPESQPISVPSTYNNDARRSSEPHLVPEEPSSPTNIANSLETESPSPPLLPRSVDSPGDTRQEENKTERPTNLPIPDKLAFGTLMRYQSMYVSMNPEERTRDAHVADDNIVHTSHTKAGLGGTPVPLPRPGKDIASAKKHDRSPDVGSEANRLPQSLENSEVPQGSNRRRSSIEFNPATVKNQALNRKPVPLPRSDKKASMQKHERPSETSSPSSGLSHAESNSEVPPTSLRKRSCDKPPPVGVHFTSSSNNSKKSTKPRPRSEISVDNKHIVLSKKLSLGETYSYDNRDRERETFATLLSPEKQETCDAGTTTVKNSIKAYSSDDGPTWLIGNTSLTAVDRTMNTRNGDEDGQKLKQSRPQKPPRLFRVLQLDRDASEFSTSAEGAASAEPFYENRGVFDLDPSAWVSADQESVESHYDILWSASPLPGQPPRNSSETAIHEMAHESNLIPIFGLKIHHKKQGSIERIQRLRKTQSLESINLDQMKLEMVTPLVTGERLRSKSSYQPGLIGYSDGSFDIESEDDLKLDSSLDSVTYMKLENEAKDTGARKKSTLFRLMRKKKSKKDRESVKSAVPIENLREIVNTVSQMMPSASEADISSALELSRWNVDDTVKFLKVKELVKLGLCPQSTCTEMLKTYDWNVLEASYAIKIHYLMAIHLELSIEEAAKLLRDNQWAIDRVLRVLRMPEFLKESEAIGFSSSEAERILSSVGGDTEQALCKMKVRRVVDVTQKPEDYCRKTLDHCQWKVDRAINFIVEEG